MQFDIKSLENRMKAALDKFKNDALTLRSGRITTSILANIKADAYGDNTPLPQIASVSVADARTLAVQVWDKNLVNNVVKAILESDIGLNPVVEGSFLRIPVPPLSQERRKEIVKLCAKYAEQARIAIRSVRKDGMNVIKNQEKNKEISQDEQKNLASKIQGLTDKIIKNVDQAVADKEKKIMQI